MRCSRSSRTTPSSGKTSSSDRYVTLNDLDALLKALNRYGVTKYSSDDVTIELDPGLARRRKPRRPAEDPSETGLEGMSEEDLAVYSAPDSLPTED